MITATYIYHSGFLVETPEALLIFDYWKDPAKVASRIQNSDKPLYVLISHHHKDHLNREVFSWRRASGNIHFIISKDVFKFCRYQLREHTTYNGVKPDPQTVHILSPGEKYTDSNISIKAYDSTDTGNSWVVTTKCGKRIFHAGDLNAWTWKDESSEAEWKADLKKYTVILETIASENRAIDLAMFPVDSRIGTDWFAGAKLFLEAIDVKMFLPMHFELGQTEEEKMRYHRDAARFDLYANPHRGCCAALQTPGASACSALH